MPNKENTFDPTQPFANADNQLENELLEGQLNNMSLLDA